MIKQFLFFFVVLVASTSAFSQVSGDYKVNPGDVLEVFVWNEEAITRQVIVRPDGFLSLPLAGEVKAGGRTVVEVQDGIKAGLAKYLKDEPVVTVSVYQMNGNIVYVLGKVNRPGAFPVAGRVDVTQALAWAGGLNTFADSNDIKVLRRAPDGSQIALDFNYSAVTKGKKLESNVILRAGDVVVVP